MTVLERAAEIDELKAAEREIADCLIEIRNRLSDASRALMVELNATGYQRAAQAITPNERRGRKPVDLGREQRIDSVVWRCYEALRTEVLDVAQLAGRARCSTAMIYVSCSQLQNAGLVRKIADPIKKFGGGKHVVYKRIEGENGHIQQ
jgi:hypothetical protein